MDVQSVFPTRIVSRPRRDQRYSVDGLIFFPPRRRGRWFVAADRVTTVSVDRLIMLRSPSLARSGNDRPPLASHASD
jgi:hypothetical protein